LENQSGGSTINCQSEFEFFQRIARKTNATNPFESAAVTTPGKSYQSIDAQKNKGCDFKGLLFSLPGCGITVNQIIGQ
jgi:hypothetical protein